MNKFLALATVGLVSVANASYTYEYAPFADSPNDYFNFEMLIDADASYSTTYKGGDDDSQERGLVIKSEASMTFVFEFF